MNKRFWVISALGGVLSLQTCFALAATATDKTALTTTVPTTVQEISQSEDHGQIYGIQLMTSQERSEFRTRMSAAKTIKEQEQIRNENHQVMQERAESHGLILPDQQPAGKQGMGGQGGGRNYGGWMRGRGQLNR